MGTVQATAVRIPGAGVFIDGDLRIPERAAGLVVFAHGSGSSRFSRRNRQVAEFLEARGFATLLLDLLTQQGHGRRENPSGSRPHRLPVRPREDPRSAGSGSRLV